MVRVDNIWPENVNTREVGVGLIMAITDRWWPKYYKKKQGGFA